MKLRRTLRIFTHIKLPHALTHTHTPRHTHIHKCHCTSYFSHPLPFHPPPPHLRYSLFHHHSPSSFVTSPFPPSFLTLLTPLPHPPSSLLATTPPLSLGEIVGIAVGVIVLCVLVVIFIFVCGKYLFAFTCCVCVYALWKWNVQGMILD